MPKKKVKFTLNDSLARIKEDEKPIKKGRIRITDFEIVPYKFSQSYVTGEVIEHKEPICYVYPAERIIERELENGVIHSYRVVSTQYAFHYLIGTAKKLIYGDEDYRKDKKKQYDSFFGRYYFGIANRVHFQINSDFGLVVWSFLRKKRRKKKNANL
jgi:hypothetical protein